MPNGENVVHSYAAPRNVLRRISWGGVFAGIIAVLLIQLVLLLLGVAVAGGRAAATESLRGMGVGAAVWWVISSIIAGFFGAMVASRLAGVPNKTDGAFNGLVSWGTAQLVSMALAATALGTVISGGSNMLASSMQGNGNTYAYVQPEGGAATQPSEKVGEAAREAKETVEGKRPERTAQAGKATSFVALGALAMLVLSGIAAAIGGSVGTPRTFLVVPGEPDVTPRL